MGRERQRRHEKKKSDEASDIGEIPSVKNIRRRNLCSRNLGLFLQAYFPNSTGKGIFSTDHYEVIDIIEGCIFGGGWYVNSVFREFAKTTIAENSVIFALLNGWRKNCPLIGAEEDSAKQMIESIELELCGNDLLYEDFPEVCHAFRHLGGKHQRCQTQTHSTWGKCPDCRGAGVVDAGGEHDGGSGGGLGGLSDCEACQGVGERFAPALTHINCVGSEIVLPTIRLTQEQAERTRIPVNVDGYTLGSGGMTTTHGILSFKRGAKAKQPTGEQRRPDFCIVDDFQTDASAMSEVDTLKRLRKITKAIIPSSGQRVKMAIVVNGTVIEPNDGMEQLLDPKKFPAWQGRRIPILKKRATEKAEKLWFGRYAEILQSFDRNAADSKAEQDRALEQATGFYRDHRQAMDDGAEATWSTAYEKEAELSAIQHCYNVWINLGDEAFLCEGQQQPPRPDHELRRTTVEQICGKANGLARGVVPAWASRLTCHIDVQESCLYWCVLATAEGFTSHVVAYGVYPEQATGTFALGRIKTGFRTLQRVHPGTGMEGAIRAGIDALVLQLFGREWAREDGRTQRMDFGIIDAADNSTTVYEAVRRSPFAAILRAGRGWKFGAGDPSWEEFVAKFKRPTEEFFWHCWETPIESGIRLFKMDSNHWKTFVFKRLLTAAGDVGSLSLFGSPNDHAEFAKQILAPNSQILRNEKGREVEEWKTQHGVDDHLLDVLYGAFAAAARAGVVIPSAPGNVARAQRRVVVLPSESKRGVS